MYSFFRSPSIVLGAPITRVGQLWVAKYSAEEGGREGGREGGVSGLRTSRAICTGLGGRAERGGTKGRREGGKDGRREGGVMEGRHAPRTAALVLLSSPPMTTSPSRARDSHTFLAPWEGEREGQGRGRESGGREKGKRKSEVCPSTERGPQSNQSDPLPTHLPSVSNIHQIVTPFAPCMTLFPTTPPSLLPSSSPTANSSADSILFRPEPRASKPPVF